MRKKSLLLLMLLLGMRTTLCGQDLQYGFNFYFNYSGVFLINDGNTHRKNVSLAATEANRKPSYSINAFVEYSISSQSKWILGLGYQNTGSGTKKYYTSNPSNPGEEIGTRRVYSHHNIEIPINYRYVFLEKLFLQAGVSTSFNIANTRSVVTYQNGFWPDPETAEDNSAEYRVVNLMANLGIGFDYYRGDGWQLYLNPYAQMGLTYLLKNASLNRLPYSLGIATGVRF
ncbi:MAG: hypothetical protein SchgKO_10820 [Schleiferiaceae bacterium]